MAQQKNIVGKLITKNLLLKAEHMISIISNHSSGKITDTKVTIIQTGIVKSRIGKLDSSGPDQAIFDYTRMTILGGNVV